MQVLSARLNYVDKNMQFSLSDGNIYGSAGLFVCSDLQVSAGEKVHEGRGIR